MNTRFAKLAIGWGTATTCSFIIDDVLWTPAVLWFGPVIGGFLMTALALIINLLLIWAYDTLKQDFLCFESLREVQEGEHRGLWKRIIAKAIRAGKVPAFIALSLYDPFLAVIFMRKGANAYRMTKRDWIYFGLSMLIAGLGWTVICSGVACGIRFIWNSLFG